MTRLERQTVQLSITGLFFSGKCFLQNNPKNGGPEKSESSGGINEEVKRVEEFRRQLKRAFNRLIWYL